MTELTCKWKYKYRLLSSSSGCRLLTNSIASSISPFCTASRIRIRSSRVSKSTPGWMPDSMRNFSAASLNPSKSNEHWYGKTRQFITSGYFVWSTQKSLHTQRYFHGKHIERSETSTLKIDASSCVTVFTYKPNPGLSCSKKPNHFVHTCVHIAQHCIYWIWKASVSLQQYIVWWIKTEETYQ